ncbi:MAG: hypothetical protein AB8G14_06505 [Ilumatobacter sp.]
MALLEGDERSELPSMSWNSVVRETATSEVPLAPEVTPDQEPKSLPEPAQPTGPSATLTSADAPPVAFSFATEAIAPTQVATSTPAPPPPPAAEATATSTPTSTPPPPPPPSFNLPAIDLGSTAVEETYVDTNEAVPLGVAKPTFADQLPAIPEVPAPVAPAPVLPTAVAAAPPAAQPELTVDADAAPVEPTPSVEPVAEATSLADTSEQPIVVVPPTAIDQSASIPAAAGVPKPAPSIALPRRTTLPAAGSPFVVETAPTQRRPRQRKDRSGSVARVGFFLLVVAALVSAGVIFGRPYLFPEAWEPNALEFAEPIEAARGAEFIEPVLLTPQPNSTHRALVASQLLGDPAANIPMWRSLGLAGPDSTDDATLQTLISEQSPVLYSTVDGQVYYDQSYVRADRDALITQALTTAALDQEFAFSAGAPARSLDDAALVQAHVVQQARVIQQNTANRAPVVEPDMAALAFLPAVLDYRLTSPSVLIELLPPVNDIAVNPLAAMGPGTGPGPLQIAPLGQMASTSDVVGDMPIGSAVTTDRAFWYMSFASHLDPVTAYEMSNSIDRAGLQMMQNLDRTCAVSTFSTPNAAAGDALRVNLEAWSVAAPALEATVTTLPDLSIRVRSCDPGPAFESTAKFGAARQLMAWRAAELAVTNLVVAQAGSAAELDDALGLIPSTPAVVAMVEMPAGTAPGEMATAAAAAAIDVVAFASVTDAELADADG